MRVTLKHSPDFRKIKLPDPLIGGGLSDYSADLTVNLSVPVYVLGKKKSE